MTLAAAFFIIAAIKRYRIRLSTRQHEIKTIFYSIICVCCTCCQLPCFLKAQLPRYV